MVACLPSKVLVGWTVKILMYVMSTPGTHPLDDPPPDDPPAEPEPPPDEPPVGSPRGGMDGGGGGDGALGAGGGFGTAGHGMGCLSWIVIPWSFTATGWPFAVTCPATTWASPPAPGTDLLTAPSAPPP